MVRVTTNGTLRSYRSNLARATLHQAQAMNTVLTGGRRFHSFSDSPSLATQAYRARTSLARNEAQRETSSTVQSKFEQAFSATTSLSSEYDKVLGDVIKAQNGTNEAVLSTIGATVKQSAEAMVQSLNTKYGDKYIFAGADADEPPFKLENGKLLFRGLDVSDPANEEKLKEMMGETTYVDVGLGFALDENEKVIPSTAFNSAISGLSLMGYGTSTVEVNGKQVTDVPNNMVAIIAELGEVYSQFEGTTMPEGDLKDRAQALFTKLTESFESYNTSRTEIDTRAQFLKTNAKRLDDVNFSLKEEVDGLEKTDMADALTTFVYAQYSYNAALRVGNEVLSETFLDYMR